MELVDRNHLGQQNSLIFQGKNPKQTNTEPEYYLFMLKIG